MDNRKELIRMYKETPIEAGVYQIKNKENLKIFIGSLRNLKSLNRVRLMLESNTHPNKELQKDWNLLGKDRFTFDILEKLKKKEDPYFNEKNALRDLENKWLTDLQPYGDDGYNRNIPR